MEMINPSFVPHPANEEEEKKKQLTVDKFSAAGHCITEK
jgi:hypothetical protein